MPRIRSCALIFGVFISVLAFASCGAETTITILHFGDTHDELKPFLLDANDPASEVGGIARLIGTIQKEKALDPDRTLVMFAGDAIQGNSSIAIQFSTVFNGKVSFELFNGLLDFAVPGVHDFDYGLDNLKMLTRNTQYWMLAANTFNKDAKPFTGYDCVIREVDGIKIGVFGLSVRITSLLQATKNLGDLSFTPVEEAARNMVQTLRNQGADLVIALTHQGFEEDKKLARAVDGIDLIVGGLSHTNLVKGFQTIETKIAQAGFRCQNLGKVVIRYDKAKKAVISIDPTVIPITASSPTDKEAEEEVEAAAEKMESELAVTIASTDEYLEGSREIVRGTETNLANLIADVMRQRSGAEMCLINAGLVRASIEPGDIRLKDVFNVLPYLNTLAVVTLPGRTIQRLLEKSAACNPGEGRFLQVSGELNYKIKGRILADARFNGRELEPDRLYTVATSDFLANGGDNYPEFTQDSSPRQVGITIADCFQEALRALGKVNPKVEGRIIRLPDDG